MFRRRAFLGTAAAAALFAGCLDDGEGDENPEDGDGEDENCETEETTESVVYADEEGRYFPGNPGEGFREELNLRSGDELTIEIDVQHDHRAQPTLVVEAPDGERLRDLNIPNSFTYTFEIDQEGTYFVSITNERPGTEDWGEWYTRVETVETVTQEVC